MSLSPKKVLVLMSGGVDSSVAAVLLLHQGYEVIGVTLRLCGDAGEDAAQILPGYVLDARRVADRYGIAHHVLDLRPHFWWSVVEPFIEAYARGRTPNPCVTCNPRVKFTAALELAGDLGADFIASGHYARIQGDDKGSFFIRKGADPARDQSYFLYRLPREVLARTLFPLGEMTKDEVRSTARDLRLPVADKEDSQEICFVPRGGLIPFLKCHLPTCSLKPGVIRTMDGRRLGCHDGIHAFTMGQRRRLKVAAGRPLYVTGIDPRDGAVTVGDDADLFATSMRLTDLHWFVEPPAAEPMRALVRIRYRHLESPARIWPAEGGASVIFDKPQRAITPGQSAVFYDGETVIGGGIIDLPA